MSEKKGIQKERDLINYLEKIGYTAVRVAGSGGGTSRPLPDVIASNKRIIYGIELKSSSKQFIYIKKQQIKNLKIFCDKFGAYPIICIKFNYMKYTFLKISNLTKTKSNNFKITKKQILEIIEKNQNLKL